MMANILQRKYQSGLIYFQKKIGAFYKLKKNGKNL